MTHPTDRKALTDPGLWLKWPSLLLKHKTRRDANGFSKVAVLLAVEEYATTVFHTNIFLIGGRKLKDIIDDKDIRRTKYGDADALLADGWTVD